METPEHRFELNILVTTPINYLPLLDGINNSALQKWAELLPDQIATGLSVQRYGDLPGWYDALTQLPQNLKAQHVDLQNAVEIGGLTEIDETSRNQINNLFQQLIPWRKGPYKLFGIDIDTEWRSDWKWDRLKNHIASLQDRNVLDVGCGNGYHCLRMYGAGANRVIGIDPSPRFVVQFYMLKHFVGNIPVDVLPVGIEALPEKLSYFDTTFSMGVLYHRRSPMDHLLELRETLRAGGELVLETLVIDGKEGATLVPEGRYGKMNNVWFIPSVPTLMSWLTKCGFENVRCVSCETTSTDEQRATEWMTFQSLQDFLDPDDNSKTVEGHPAPLRAVILANKK